MAHIPGSHPYVSNLTGCDSSEEPAFSILDDVVPPGLAPGQWWAPAMLDPGWIAANKNQFDVMHLHFGFESFSVDYLGSCLDALAAAGRPTVFTVHDLHNPQLFDQSHHESQLTLLLARATVVTTLTRGAASEILQRWGREATVIPHPHVLDRDVIDTVEIPDPSQRATAVVGMHLGDLRPGTDARRATEHLVVAIQELRAVGVPVEAEVHLRTTVRDKSARAAVVRACGGADGVRLVEHPRLSEADLVRSVGALDAYVLPYRHGTHSGWLELCFDLGVPVLAPTVGHWLEQHDEPGTVVAFDPESVDSLAAGIASIVSRRGAADRRAVRLQRHAQRRVQGNLIAREHAEVYQLAVARAAASVTR